MSVAVITGAASGIGWALSKVCLQKGIHVVMVDKDATKLTSEAKTLSELFPNQVLAMPCDVTQPEDVTKLAAFTHEHYENIDWIYNIAGIIGTLAPIWDLKPKDIRNVLDVNLFGMIHVIQAFMPYLFEQSNPSHIVNMASLYALCTGSQMAAYSMSKHAVLALSESLYYDLKRMEKPVEVSVVFPSFTDTGLLNHSKSDHNQAFHESLASLLTHSRPAIDVAEHIIHEVEQKRFYILPDKEVKGYCETRTQSILLQDNPHINNIEKLINSLMRRKS